MEEEKRRECLICREKFTPFELEYDVQFTPCCLKPIHTIPCFVQLCQIQRDQGRRNQYCPYCREEITNTCDNILRIYNPENFTALELQQQQEAEQEVAISPIRLSPPGSPRGSPLRPPLIRSPSRSPSRSPLIRSPPQMPLRMPQMPLQMPQMPPQMAQMPLRMPHQMPHQMIYQMPSMIQEARGIPRLPQPRRTRDWSPWITGGAIAGVSLASAALLNRYLKKRGKLPPQAPIPLLQRPLTQRSPRPRRTPKRSRKRAPRRSRSRRR